MSTQQLKYTFPAVDVVECDGRYFVSLNDLAASLSYVSLQCKDHPQHKEMTDSLLTCIHTIIQKAKAKAA